VGQARKAGAPPARSAQRLESLRKANEIRASRAQLKNELATGAVRMEEILVRLPEFARTERVSVLLLAVPKYGRVRVSRLLTKARISESKTLGGLSDRQRAELIAHFRR
jgi:S13-like H2TH domain